MRILTGASYDLRTYPQDNELLPSTDQYVVFCFNRFKSDEVRKKLFQCKFGGSCHKIMPNRSKFIDHMRAHTKDKPFTCPMPGCNKSFGQRCNVKQHIQEVHEQLKPWECDHCSMNFSKKYNRDNH